MYPRNYQYKSFKFDKGSLTHGNGTYVFTFQKHKIHKLIVHSTWDDIYSGSHKLRLQIDEEWEGHNSPFWNTEQHYKEALELVTNLIPQEVFIKSLLLNDPTTTMLRKYRRTNEKCITAKDHSARSN